MKTTTKLWIGLATLIVLSPLGLIIPEYFKAGAAWGEWGADEMHKLVGYTPQGLEKLSRLWNAPIADYAIGGSEGKGMVYLSVGYIISALVGIVATVGVMYLLGKVLVKKK